MNLENQSLEALQKGYATDGDATVFTCVFCGEAFSQGEIYPLEGKLYDAAKAIQIHLQFVHPDYISALIWHESKYNTLTDNQKKLLTQFQAGASDKDIAKALAVSTSTVRHHKFTFREKAKQAKLYLAIYEAVFGQSPPAMMPIPDQAKQVDERFIISTEEQDRILAVYCESLEPLRLKAFPPKEKKKIVLLTKIAELLEPGVRYSEKQLNQILSAVYEDYVTLRRYLIEYGFLNRTNDGAAYWLN